MDQNGAIRPAAGRLQAAKYRNSILRALDGGPRKPLAVFGFPDCLPLLCAGAGRFAACYFGQPLHEQVIASNWYSVLSCLKSECGEARVPLLARDNRENSGFGEVASGARREADGIDFLP